MLEIGATFADRVTRSGAVKHVVRGRSLTKHIGDEDAMEFCLLEGLG